MKKFLIKVGIWIAEMFDKSFGWLQLQADATINVVNIIKGIIENPATDIIVALTPTKADDAILSKAKDIVLKASLGIETLLNIANDATSNEEKLKAITEYLKALTKDERAGFYVQMSGHILQVLADGKISLAEAISLTQYLYAKQKN